MCFVTVIVSTEADVFGSSCSGSDAVSAVCEEMEEGGRETKGKLFGLL